MSNHLAVATVTATLQKMLQAAVQRHVEGARVTTVVPANVGNGTPETGVNLFLYHAQLNPALKVSDQVMRNQRGSGSSTRKTALELHYLLSFYGSNVNLEPQRLLGSVVQAFSDRTILTREMLQATISDSTFEFLSESDLTQQTQQLQIFPIPMDLEELSKLWSVLFQTAYVLSMAYKVMLVVIDGEAVLPSALPVRERRLGRVEALWGSPIVTEVQAATGRADPITVNTTLLIQGQNLQGHNIWIRLGGVEALPIESSPSDLKLPLLNLPSQALRAGVQTLQVVAIADLTPAEQAEQPPRRRYISESSAVPFVLRPVITSLQLQAVEELDTELRLAALSLELDLAIQPQQRVVLTLNERSTYQPLTFSFEATPLTTPSPQITIPMAQVKTGEYFVRLQVDGAESILVVDTDPSSPTFNGYVGPTIVIA
ncbi:MAG: DUF4255 domain-containing protein [Cyanobacteria bacterium P01_H01_bin.121]